MAKAGGQVRAEDKMLAGCMESLLVKTSKQTEEKGGEKSKGTESDEKCRKICDRLQDLEYDWHLPLI